MIAVSAVIGLAAMALSAATALATEPVPYPNPMRFENEILAFEAQDKLFPPPYGAVLCIGSSSMRMWHDTLVADLHPLTLIPRGFGGSTMLDVLYYCGRIVVPYRPRAILLYEGDNDVDFGVSPERILATFAQFDEAVRATLPETRIYVLAVKPSPARWHKWPQMEQTNVLLRERCAADPRLAFIDIATAMLGDDGLPLPRIYLEDELHLNAVGYEIWRKEVRRVVVDTEALLERP